MTAEAELYLETVWTYIPDELKKRIVAAVRKSVSDTPDPQKRRDVFISSLSREHMEAVEWITDKQGQVRGGTVFTPATTPGNKTQSGLRLHNEMTDFLMRRVVGGEPELEAENPKKEIK